MGQINLFGEEVLVEAKAKKLDYILQELQVSIQDKEKRVVELENLIKALRDENEKLNTRLKIKPEIVEIGAFEKSNRSPLINIFANWIGYAMFIKDCKFEKMDKDKQNTYREVWDKCVKPMYYEFCEQFQER